MTTFKKCGEKFKKAYMDKGCSVQLLIIPILLPLFRTSEQKSAEPVVLFDIPEDWLYIMAPLLSFFTVAGANPFE